MRAALKRIALLTAVVILIGSFVPGLCDYSRAAQEGVRTHTEKFSADYSFNGIYAQCTEFFHVGDWNIMEDPELCLRYEVSQLLAGEAELDIALNGAEVYRGTPTGEDGQQSITILLPQNLVLRDGVNTLTIEARLRDGAKKCADAAAFSRWLNIFQESTVSIKYMPAGTCNTIGEFYEAFTSIDALEYSESAVCMYDGATSAVYSAAAKALSGLAGNAVLSYENIGLRSISSASDMSDLKYALLLCDYDTLPNQIANILPDSVREAAQAGIGTALIKINGTNILVVTAGEDSMLEGAGVMLSNGELMRNIDQPEKVFGSDEDFRMDEWRIEQYLYLTDSAITVHGVFGQTMQFYIDYPANRTIAKSSQLSLDYRYSDHLNFNRSLVTVYINDVPIASKALTKENAAGDTALFDIPTDLDISGSFSVKIVFDLEVGDDWCNLLPEDMPWASVESSSMLKLASVDQAPLIFDNYPSPFLYDGRFNNVVVLLPDDPQDADIQSLRSLMLTCGRFLRDNTGNVRVAFASDTGNLDMSNIIAIGKAQVNPIVRENGDNLCFSYGDQGIHLDSKEMAMNNDYAKTLGTVQLIRSPYSKRAYALLIISATTDEGLLHGAELLGSTEQLWKLNGDAAASDGDEIYCYRYHPQDDTKSPAKPAETFMEKVNPFLLPGGALLLLLAGFAMLTIKYARKDRI